MEYVTDISREDYTKFFDSRPEANFLQSWQWGETHKSLGDVVVREAISQNGQTVAIWTGIVKNARRGRYLEVPGGPLMDWQDKALVERVSDILRSTAKKYHCVFIRLRPQCPQSSQILATLKSIGARKAQMHLHAEHTNIIDIRPSESELLANMRRQTRYEVRRVEKRGLVVSYSAPTSEEIDEFYDLQAETARRHNFVQSPRRFFHALAENFADQLELYRVTKDGATVNLALVIYSGLEADYYEAASTIEARKEPGAYGAVWQAILRAKTKGCQKFNLWGIAYTSDPNHRYAGVTTFKRGFGGQDTVYAPAHDIVISPAYLKTWLIETIRKKLRKL